MTRDTNDKDRFPGLPFGGVPALWATVLLLLAGLTTAAHCQQTAPLAPDCQYFQTFTTASNGTSYDNRTNSNKGCVYWTVLYVANGFSAVSFVWQSAPDSSGTAGTFVTFAGTLVSGSNPSTATTQAAAGFNGYYPWVRAKLTSVTGTGSVQVYAYGYKSNPASGSSGSTSVTQGTVPWVVGGTVGTFLQDAGARIIVAGPTATGAAPTTSPLYIAGKDSGGNTRPLATSTSGGVVHTNSATPGDGVANSSSRPLTDIGAGALPMDTFKYVFNGTTWDREFVGTSSTPISLSSSGNTEIIAASASTTIRLLHISLSAASAVNIKFVTGTGTNCGSGTADVTGTYQNVTTLTLDLGSWAAMRSATSGALCVNLSSAVTVGGFAVYARY